MESGVIRNSFARQAFPVALAVVFGLLLFVPRNAPAVVEFVLVLLAPALFAVAYWGFERPAGRWTRVCAWTVLVAAGLLVASAAVSGSPRAAFFGARGQHTGAGAWLALAAVFLIVSTTHVDRRLILSARAVSVFAAALSLAAMLDALGFVRATRLIESASGLMENSISLGQILVIGAGAGVAWAFMTRSVYERLAGLVCATLALIGIVISSARAPMYGLVAALALMSVWWLIWKAAPRRIAEGIAGATVVAAAMAALGGAYWLTVSSAKSVVWLTEKLSGRVAIWDSAFSRLDRLPALGFGPDQFTAWATWDMAANGNFTYTGTNDPHNALIYWLLAGGIAGLVILLTALYLLATRAWRSLVASRFSLGRVGLVTATGAWAVSLLFSWTNITAGLCAVVLLAALFAEDEAGQGERARVLAFDDEGAEEGKQSAPVVAMSRGAAVERAVGITASVACLIVLVLAVPAIAAEADWARDIAVGSGDAETLMHGFDVTGDPVYAADARASAQALGKLDEGLEDRLVLALEPHADWSVDAALSLNLVEYGRAKRGVEDSDERAATALELGKKADPASGLWDFVAASEASVLGDEKTAVEKANAALKYPLSDEARVQMKAIIAP